MEETSTTTEPIEQTQDYSSNYGDSSNYGVPYTTPNTIPTTEPTTAPTGNMYAEGDWRYNLPQDPEIQKIASKFKTPEEMCKGYYNLTSLIGKKVNDFSKENWDTYAQMMFQATDIPAEASGYNIEMGDDNCLSEEDIEGVKEIAHACGMNTAQAQNYAIAMNTYGQAVTESAVETATECMQELARTWGDSYEAKLQAVNDCVVNFWSPLMECSPDEAKEELEMACLSPRLMKAFAKIGEMNMDSTSRGYYNITPTDAAIQLQQLKDSPETFAAMSQTWHPRHNETIAKFRYLQGLAGGR